MKFQLSRSHFEMILNLNKKSFSRNSAEKLKRLFQLMMPLFETELFHSQKFRSNMRGHKIILSLTVCGSQKMRHLNQQYRGKNQPTDVLSFPIYENLRVRQANLLPELLLGDIVICKDVALKQSREAKISFEKELVYLFTHGLLHLVGFDHEISEQEERMMFRWEKKLAQACITKLGLNK